MLEVSRAARALPASVHRPQPVDLVIDGLALMATDGLTGDRLLLPDRSRPTPLAVLMVWAAGAVVMLTLCCRPTPPHRLPQGHPHECG